MKKLLALFICLVIADIVLAVVIYVQENVRRANIPFPQMSNSIATSDAAVKATQAPASNWAAEKAAFAQTAAADTKAPITWSITVVQNEEMVVEQEGAYRLQKAPFTLRASIPRQALDERPFIMYINVLNRDEVYQKVQPGSIKNVICEANAPDCFAFSGFAEPGYSTQSLALSLKDGIGTHLLYYRDAQDTRWDKVEFRDAEVILERNVSKITSLEGENQVQELPIEEYGGNELYLVFLLDYRAGPVVTEDEVKKAVLRFE